MIMKHIKVIKCIFIFLMTFFLANRVNSQEWSGSGFALKDGFIVTNYHVIENAETIWIHGIKGDFPTKYSAKVVATDKFNDIALLKVSDSNFTGFGTIPYNVKTSVSDVGEDIFVLGYPLTSTMGEEIKLTTGVISSRTGFQGDVSLYQISAPIQPGNSGGPLFDYKGNLVGIVSSKHTGAENVGYAIKTSYLRNLIESTVSKNILPTNAQTATLPLTEKIKVLKNFVFMISCSGRTVSGSSYANNFANANEVNGHEYVDLGLSVKWATCNLGANKPEDYGNYYAWGETSTKTEYAEYNSKTYGKSMNDISGNVNYDVARANWGGKWRLPTKTEMQELIDKCTWTWTTQNGVKGYKVTGPSGASIFLPAAACRYGSSLFLAGSDGYYWSSTPGEYDDYRAYALYFGSSYHGMYCYYRLSGRSVRPILE